jgi:carboxymethylenebutenolidase
MRSLVTALALATCLAPASHAQDWAKAKLEKSPRHLEYVKVKSGDREITCLVAYPEVKEKATAVLVIHEIFGLADWPKLVADEFAAAGYIAIAPDLLSGSGPDGGGTDAFTGGDGVRKAIMDLKPDQVTADLDAAAKYVTSLPAANGKLAVAGFCWGGSQTFRYATNNPDIGAALVFYGGGPTDASAIAKIKAPVHGFYGGNDARVNASIPATTALMKEAGKTFEPVIYEGAGHGFLRAGEAPDASPANKKARDAAWKRIKEIVGKL